MSLPNYPHKLTKTAEPWLGGGAALGGSELHSRVTSAAVRSRHFVLVAAAAVPLPGGRHGRRLLQLRVSALDGQTPEQFSTVCSNSRERSHGRQVILGERAPSEVASADGRSC